VEACRRRADDDRYHWQALTICPAELLLYLGPLTRASELPPAPRIKPAFYENTGFMRSALPRGGNGVRP